EHAPMSCDEHAKHGELAIRETDLTAAGIDQLVRIQIDLPALEVVRGARWLPRPLPKDHPHVREHLTRTARLAQIVIRPELEAEDAVLLIIQRAQHDERRIAVGGETT